MSITVQQQEQLLKPLNASRVAKRSGGGGKSLSYLEAWDVRAHLIRIFGFGGWSFDVLTADLAFEEKAGSNWVVGYKVVGRLTIRDPWGVELCTYTEAAVGGAQLPQRGEAHDMSIKTGESDCLKRCAMNLGTQFGLSLYDDGATRDVVMKTLAGPARLDPDTDVPTDAA
jgi:recombination DNA repair RAD52 pathway protein